MLGIASTDTRRRIPTASGVLVVQVHCSMLVGGLKLEPEMRDENISGSNNVILLTQAAAGDRSRCRLWDTPVPACHRMRS